MATCSQIERQIQAYLDGELPRSEQVIFEQHLTECSACAADVRLQKKVSALLFEVLAHDRLQTSLRQGVAERISAHPIRVNEDDLDAINWRAKNPGNVWVRVFRRTPIAVAALLILVAALIRYYWPESVTVTPSTVGMVTGAQGLSLCHEDGGANLSPVKLANLIERGARLETTSDARMLVSLRGRTDLKLNHNTKLAVLDERTVTLEQGELHLTVGKDRTPFVVNTPQGKVRVLGTIFLVRLSGKDVAVFVEEGVVQVEGSGPGGNFVAVSAGESVKIGPDGRVAMPRVADVESEMLWANAIVPNREAKERFYRMLPPVTQLVEISASHIYRIPLVYENTSCAIHAIRLYWRAQPFVAKPCGYDVFVYDQDMKPLFKSQLDAALLRDSRRTYYDVQVPGKPLTGMRAIAVSLVPDFSTGSVETEFEVKAVVLPRDN